MKLTKSFLGAAVGALALGILFAPLPALAGQLPSATGAGFFANSTRVFAFNAVGHSDGSTTGEGTLIVPGQVFFHFQVTCLQVIGNVATMTGTITDNSWVGAPGLTYAGDNFWFRVVDNGEGKKAAPDQMTFFIFDDVPPPCTNVESQINCVPTSCSAPITGTAVDGIPLNSINSGNIQVRAGS